VDDDIVSIYVLFIQDESTQFLLPQAVWSFITRFAPTPTSTASALQAESLAPIRQPAPLRPNYRHPSPALPSSTPPLFPPSAFERTSLSSPQAGVPSRTRNIRHIPETNEEAKVKWYTAGGCCRGKHVNCLFFS